MRRIKLTLVECGPQVGVHSGKDQGGRKLPRFHAGGASARVLSLLCLGVVVSALAIHGWHHHMKARKSVV